jgi:hypothetical protein
MTPLVDLMQLLNYRPTWLVLAVLTVWACCKLAGYFDGPPEFDDDPPCEVYPLAMASALNGYIDRLEADEWERSDDLRPLLRIALDESERASRDAARDEYRCAA